MALIKCPDCNKKISDSSEKCVKCGATITPEYIDHFRKKNNRTKYLIGFGILLIFIFYQITSETEKKEEIEKELRIYNSFMNNMEKNILNLKKYISENNTNEVLLIVNEFIKHNQIKNKDFQKLATDYLLKIVKPIPEKKYEDNIKYYKLLYKINPNSKTYFYKIKKYENMKKSILLHKEKIESQFSSWDGSHINFTKIIKKNMNDSSSYKHVETKYWDNKTFITVKTTFSGKNAFGAIVKNTIAATFDLEGNLIKILN